jgi:CheY-like chemotaxis protein
VKTILLIDDYEPVVVTLKAILEEQGFRVIATTKPTDGLLIATTGYDVDLVITDFTMPGMSGGELIAEIHKHRWDIPVIMLSAANPPRCAADAYVVKDGARPPQELLNAIFNLLGDRKRCARTEAEAEQGLRKAN